MSLREQLSEIRDRILRDTNYLIKEQPIGICRLGNNMYSENIKKNSIIEQPVKLLDSSKYVDKPILIIEDIVIPFINRKHNEVYIKLANLLTDEYISEISLYKPTDVSATALFGARGLNGVITTKLKKKKYLKLFKKLKLANKD